MESSFFESISVVDLVALGILIFFFILGLFKGFTWQVMRIATIAVGMLLARALSPSFSCFLEKTISGLDGSPYSGPIAYFLIFVAVFIVGTLLAFLMKGALKRLKLQAYDWLLGALMGILTGAIIVVVIVLVLVSFLPEEHKFRKDIEQSKTLEYSGWAISVADPFIPPQLQEKVMEVLDEAGLLKEGLKDVWEKSDSEDDEETEKDR